MNFYEGSIEEFEGVTQVDMVVTLHACDTATDYALYKALRWGASVILSVPCCQHELNKQISASEFEPERIDRVWVDVYSDRIGTTSTENLIDKCHKNVIE